MLPKGASPSNGAPQTVAHYKGLFSSRGAPTTRAYFILFSFFLGVLLITLGAVFYNVILIQPVGSKPMHAVHVPPVPIACTLVIMGIITILLSIGVAWRYGLDDGDDSLDEDKFNLAQEDVLDQHHQCTEKNLPV